MVPQISLIIPSTLTESTNKPDGFTMINVKHGEPFPVYISVTNAVDSLQLTLEGPQDGALPPTLMTSAFVARSTWSELFVGNSTTTATVVGKQNYRYCLEGTQNCSSTISVSYSSPAMSVVDVDEISPEWDFTLSEQTAAGCRPNAEFTFPTLLSQEGNTFTSRSVLTYTGIVDGDSYSLAYRDPNFNVGPNVGTYIDTHTTQYSPDSMALSGPGVWWWTDRAGFLCRGTYNIVYTPRLHDVVPQISLIIPSTLTESTNEIIGSTMIDVKRGEPFPVYISVDTFPDIPDSLLLTLDGPQDGALPTTLMTSALSAGVTTWSELFVGNSTTTAVGKQNYRYCLAGTQNCSSTISVSYSSPDDPIVDVDEIGSEWEFTLSDQTATAGCSPATDRTSPTLLSQEGNIFTSIGLLPEISTYTGIVDGYSYSLAYRDPDFGGGGGTFIDTLVTQYSAEPMLSGPGVWWWTNKAGFLCRGTYNIIYTPRPRIDSIAVADMSVSEDVGAVTVTVTLTHSPVQPVAARLEIEGTATDADYQVGRDINFGIGERQTTLNLDIVDDDLVEPNETIILKAVSQDLTLVGASSTTLTIEDNDVDNVDNHGDTIETATTLTLTLDTSVSGRIDPADDADYFRIDISTPIIVSIFTTSDLDTVGRLYDGTNNFLQSDNQSGTDDNFLIRRLLEPGIYYIEVSGSGTETGDYVLHVDVVDIVDNHGNTIETATTLTLTLDTSVSGTIDPANDVDYFRIDISTPTFVSIFTTGDLDTIGTLQDNTGSELTSNDQSGEENNFLISTSLDPGIYFIEVSGSGTETGDYVLHVDVVDIVDNHGNTIETATTLTLTLDTSVSGRIDPADDADYFRIDISTPIIVSIFTTSDLDTVGILYDGTNNFLQSDNQSGTDDNFLIRRLLEPGIYYIEVSGSGTETGDYVLHVVDVVDNHGNTIETATTLTLNTSVSGTINYRHDRDYFSLNINTQTFVSIFTTGNLYTAGTLYDGTNTFLQSDFNSVGTNFLIGASLNPGTYFIEVVNPFGNTGNYTFYVLTDDHSPTPNRATVLSLNTPKPGTIEHENNVDYFSLEIDAPTDVNIFTTGNLNTIGTLYIGTLNDGTVTFLQSDDDSGEEDNFLIRTPLEPGIYYIQVEGFGTGDYVLHVDVFVDDHGNTIETATTLSLNTSVSGTIDPGNDLDYFSLKISTPTDVNIFTTGNLDTEGILYDGTNNFLQSDDNSGEGNDFLIRIRLNPGTYYIEMVSYFGNTGNYVLHVDVVDIVDNHGNTTETATTLSLNTSVSGTIDPGNDRDYFSLKISTPTDVNIFTTGNLDTEGRLYDGTNNFLQSDDNSGEGNDFLIRIRLNPGTYYIEVVSYFGNTGNYVLHVDVVDIVDNHSDTIAMATELTLNTSVSGTIDPANDVDYFRIDISTPTFVSIFTTGDLNTAGSLQDNMGNELASDDSYPNFLIPRHLDPGTYYIEVGSFGSFSTGDYTLYILTDDHSPTTNRATTLTLNTSVSGTIDPGNDRDYFSLKISTPTDVNIFTTGNLDMAGILYDGTNNFLQFDSDSGEGNNFLIRTPLEPGTYYIEVIGSGTETGDYVLHVDVVDIVDNHGNTIETATTLSLNTSVSGTIDPKNDQDYFSLKISTPTDVNIFTTGNLDTSGILYDGTNNFLQFDNDSGEGNNFLFFIHLEPGTYYIEVVSSFSNTGNYVLHVGIVVDDHSNTTATATTLPLNTSVSGTIAPEDDVDYFSIEIDTQTDVNIFTTDNLDTVGTLYDGTNTFLQDNDQSGTDNNFLIFYRLDPGTYYIEVESFNSNSIGNYVLHVDEVVPQISLIIPSTLTLVESTNEVVGITMIDVKHGEPFPVYISVTNAVDSLQLTLDGPQDGALPPTLMISALGAGATWSELFVGNSTTTATVVGQQNYRYCLAGTQNCSSNISVNYSSPDDPIVDVDEIGSEWEFTVSGQTATGGCSSSVPGTFPTLLSQEGNTFTSFGELLTYTGIVDGDSYSLAYRDPDLSGGTFIDTLVTQYSAEPMLSGPGVWWWTNKAGFLCRGTYNIIYTPRPRIDSIAVASTSVSEAVGNVTVTVTLTYPPVQPVAARLEIEGTATDADYQVERNINFGVGERQTTLNLVIVDDDLAEPDEIIILRAVSQDPSKLVGTTSTTLTIEDNDVLTISFQQADYVIFEGTTGTITLVADPPPLVKIQIRLTTDSVTALSSKYQLSTTIIVFEPGQKTASFEVSIINNDDLQATQEFRLSIVQPDNSTTRETISEIMIRVKDDDAPIAGLAIVGDDIRLEEELREIISILQKWVVQLCGLH